jgi:hypothetical protein
MKWTGVLVLALSAAVWGQEGAAALPSNYKVTFENAWVKVTSVRYEPMQKLQGHAHTPNPSAYVYLNDGPPVIFRHIGGKGVAATRAATRAGAFRVYRGLDEIHEVENTGPTPSEFLRVELKTALLEPGKFFGKFERPSPSPEPVVHFSHPQVTISRLWAQPGQALALSAGTEPALVVALGPVAGMVIGQTRWIDTSGSVQLKNESGRAIDVLRFDFKTRPAGTR